MGFSKRLFDGVLIISLSAFFSRAIGLFSSPLMTRLLGPEPYGLIALMGTLINISGTIALLGRETGYLRVYSQGAQPHRISVESYFWRSTIVTASLVAVAAGFIWHFIAARADIDAAEYTPYVAGSVFIAPMLAMAVIRCRIDGHYRRIAYAATASALFGVLVSISWAMLISADAWALAIGALSGGIVNLVLMRPPITRAILARSNLSPGQKSEIFALGLPSLLTAPIYWALSSGDRWALALYSSTHDVGVYNFSAQFGLLGMLVQSGVMSSWLPESSRAYDEHGASALRSIGLNLMRLLSGLLIVFLAVSAAGGDIIRLIAPQDFHEGAQVVTLLGAGVLFYGVSSLFTLGLFVQKRMSWMVLAWCIGGLAATVVYITAVPRLGMTGAALGYSSGFMMIMVVTALAGQSVLALPLAYGRIAAAVLISGIAAAALSHPWSESPIISLLLKFPVGLCVAAILAVVLGGGLISEALNRIRVTFRDNVGDSR